MSSLEIAELTGKEHRNVMRDIRLMLTELHGEGGVLRFEQSYRNAQNKEQPCYALPYDETMVLVTGYSIPLRAAVVRRWRELEEAKPVLPNFADPVAAARAWADAGCSGRSCVPLSCAQAQHWAQYHVRFGGGRGGTQGLERLSRGSQKLFLEFQS